MPTKCNAENLRPGDIIGLDDDDRGEVESVSDSPMQPGRLIVWIKSDQLPVYFWRGETVTVLA